MKIGIIGTGQLGKALILVLKKDFDIIASSRNKSNYNGVKIISDNRKVAEEADVVFLTVKPQNMEEVLNDIKGISREKLVVSFAAGLKLEYYEKRLDVIVVRAMTNLAIKNKSGFTAYILGKNAGEKDESILEELFSKLGYFHEIKDEESLDIITGLSGSGIAFFLEFFEGFLKTAIEYGVSTKLSREVIEKTVLGSLSFFNNVEDFEKLIKSIASKGGTTEKGLDHFNVCGLRKIIFESISKAIEKSKLIGDEYV